MNRVLLPQIRSSHGYSPAVYDERSAPCNHPAVVEKIVADDRELRVLMAARMRITNLARLDQRVQFFLPVLESHRHVSLAARVPEKVVIIAVALVLIERGDGAIHSVGALESHRRIDLSSEPGCGRVEEILLRFAELERVVERDWDRLRFFHLIRLRGSRSAAGEEEAKQSRRDSHDASIKGEERAGVNFPRASWAGP